MASIPTSPDFISQAWHHWRMLLNMLTYRCCENWLGEDFKKTAHGLARSFLKVEFYKNSSRPFWFRLYFVSLMNPLW